MCCSDNRGQSGSKKEAECDLKTLYWSYLLFYFFLLKDPTNLKIAKILVTPTVASVYCLYYLGVEVTRMKELPWMNESGDSLTKYLSFC